MSVSFSELTPVEEIGGDVAERLANGNQYVHIEGLPILSADESQRNEYIRGISSVIGELTMTGAQEGSELWRLDSATSPNASQIPFHTDNPFREQPEEVVSFWNIRSSAEGGENLILPVTDLLDWMGTQPEHAELLEELTTTQVPFSFGDSQATGIILQPDVRAARYDQKYIVPEHATLGLRFAQALRAARVLAREVKLSEGSALFFNNRTVLHARAPYSDPNRLSIRVRMTTDNRG